ncbi:serine/threonine-protein kinase [Pseudanabaena sp. FACHB-2040]|uniref:serine/threonine-protein kinase n=1 Tax=Pseudanabaena sp. FACHB-2040 TaxID=2692859 RepID=UPI00168369AE|nr:serine/threonine-protein kinase [Pseudanabaena sp. FACHB-2040]MBD2256220.1 serine/threonine protein kinase [Pseudanabaena sp. FACHB-2040]
MYDSPANLADFRDERAAQAEIRSYCRTGQLFRERYRILRVLGRGGFGVTFLAQDASLPGSPLCVIKQLCPKTRNEMSLARARVRFVREARILAKLGGHSQIPQLLDYFTAKEDFYLVQEFVQGETLAQEVRRSGRQSENQVKHFLREILPVLKFIHRHRIIHRDIKPPNIIRCQEDNRLVLIDFGAVRELLSEGEEGSFQSPVTQFVGTPGFAPPEQQTLRPIYASDIYALGMTCLYLLTAKVPFEFDVDTRTCEVRWEHTVTLSPHFAKVLRKMVQPALDQRYQTVEELERALALEPYLDVLSDCMNTQTPVADSPYGETPIVPLDGYLTPTQREAAAIRRWRMRRTACKQPRQRTGQNNSTATLF